MKKVVVIGGGVNGLFSAYYLAKEGHKVTLIDQRQGGFSSDGNAGMITPSHFIPLAQPGMIAQGIRWMFSSKSPFYIKPRLSLELLQWGRAFYKNSSQKHVEESKEALLDLSLMSRELYREFASDHPEIYYHEDGLLMLCLHEKTLEEEIQMASLAREMGLEVEVYDREALKSAEKGLQTSAVGGVLFKSDGHLKPHVLLQSLESEIEKLGVARMNVLLEDLKTDGVKIISCSTSKGEVTADEFVLAAGSWSSRIAEQCGLKIQLLPGKGYSFEMPNEGKKPTLPTVLVEGKAAVTPMGENIRFGGTLEITTTTDKNIRMNRVQGIVNAVNDFYPELNISTPKPGDVWYGFRPCTPTGLPLIYRSDKMKNLTLATGHAMMGLALGPATGKLVSEIVSEKATTISIERFI